MIPKIAKILSVEEGDLRKALPFIFVYALIFSALTMADTISLSLLLEKDGFQKLPLYFGIAAFANLILVNLYNTFAGYICVRIVLQRMLGVSCILFLATFLFIKGGFEIPYGVLFVIREVSFILILMHFGNFLQTYFEIKSYEKINILVFAGGRFGAIIATFILEFSLTSFGVLNSVLLYVFAILLAIILLQKNVCGASQIPYEKLTSDENPYTKILFNSSFFQLLAIGGFLFIVARWLLNFQYNSIFSFNFMNAEELSLFINRYTQIALIFALIFQVFIANRLFKKVGFTKSFTLYNLLFLVACVVSFFINSLTAAVFARFIENEFRTSLRNPIFQTMTGQFSSSSRIVVRSFLQGVINPVGILFAVILIQYSPIMDNTKFGLQIAIILAAVYFLLSFGINREFHKKLESKQSV